MLQIIIFLPLQISTFITLEISTFITLEINTFIPLWISTLRGLLVAVGRCDTQVRLSLIYVSGNLLDLWYLGSL